MDPFEFYYMNTFRPEKKHAFGVCNPVRLKPACAAPDTSWNIDIKLDLAFS